MIKMDNISYSNKDFLDHKTSLWTIIFIEQAHKFEFSLYLKPTVSRLHVNGPTTFTISLAESSNSSYD